MMNTNGEEINSHATVVSKKIFLLSTITNTDGEELTMDTHEISVQSAVMSGLENVNSSQFFTRSNINSLHGYSLKLYKEYFHKANEYSKFGLNFPKKCYQSTIK